MVDVVDEHVQRCDALLQSALQIFPLGGGDDARQHVERKDPLGAGLVAVHAEGDAHAQQRTLGRRLTTLQFAGTKRLYTLDENASVGPRLAIITDQFIVKAAGFVVLKTQCFG